MNSVDPRGIHRKLVFRIFSMGLIIAIITGTIVWQTERNSIGKDVLFSAKAGFKNFNDRIWMLLNEPDNIDPDLVKQKIVRAMGERRDNQFGWFVSIGIYDLQGKLIAIGVDDSYENIELVLEKTGRLDKEIEQYKTMRFNVIEIEGIPHMQIISPLKNDLNELSAYGETFFAVSQEALDRIRAKAVKTAGVSVLIVILTTGLLYPVVAVLINQVSSLSSKLFEANLEILKVLGSAVAKRDSDTDSHNYRVTIISVKLAETLGISKQKIQRLIKGAFLHDVGKIGIEDDILHKPGRLNEDEFTAMKNHVSYGIEIVEKAEWIKEAVEIVGYHHEKFDGSGYGNGYKGDQIPEIARVFCIADVFDALTSKRPYKDPYSFQKTMDIINSGRGNHFDPEYVDVFNTIAPEMFEAYAKREDDALKTELGAMIKQYFY